MYSLKIYLVCLALLVVGSLADIYTSTLFPKYGLREGNKLFRKPDGSMDLNKAVIALVVFIEAQGILYFAVGGDVGLFANLLCGGFGFYRIIQGLRNWDLIRKKKRQTR